VSRYGVILFSSSHDAIRAEKLLHQVLPVTLIPTPRRFSASCGIALRFDAACLAQVSELMEVQNIAGELWEMD